MKIESKILTNLVYDEEYCRKVLPFIKAEYFAARPERVVVEEVVKFFSKFNKPATKDILKIEIGNRTDLSEVDLKNVNELINGFSKDESHDEWLIQSTEKFCKDRAVYNAILESIGIIDGKDQKRTQESIPNILSDALAVSFDNHVGHDYILDADARYEYYHRKEDKVAFDIELLNKITAGGLSRKSLSCILAQTGGGKSLFMCHVAAATLMQGKNVLYITMEMAEERIAERIDANLLNLAMDELKVVDKSTFDNRMTKLSSKTQGKLIIKEYPTASAHSGHFRALIEELKLKKDFIPDLLVVDYLNICSSARLRMGASVNSYTFIKSIAEELRGLAVEYNIPALTATQVTRSGFCLDLSTKVNTQEGEKYITDINTGDKIETINGWNTVTNIWPIQIKERYLIKTESGKSIICSGDHKFPIDELYTEKTINQGLSVGDNLIIK